ncbi:MAG: polysaccharide deacetylase family protein, partial [Planctomycetes bacterium]|nr:polysaccharide deacetylase family protein [Planctomycetota bacterium]
MTLHEALRSTFSDPRHGVIANLVLPAVLLLLITARRAGAQETVVTLEFDDNNASQYPVRQMLRDRGMRATFFIPSPRIGRSGYMTLAQLRDLQADGNEIGGHTLDHLDLTTLSAAEAERQVCEDRAALVNLGFDPVSFAYPFGANNESVQAIVANCGYQSARSIGGVGGCASCPNAESLPPANRYATRTRASVRTDTTLATLQGYVTAAEQSGGGWVQLVIHYICEGSTCPSTSISDSNLEAFLDWLAPRASSGTVVRTIREALNPSEPPPPPPPPPSEDTTPPVTVIRCSPRGCSEWSDGPVT